MPYAVLSTKGSPHLPSLWVHRKVGLDELSVKLSQARDAEIRLICCLVLEFNTASFSISDTSSLEATVDNNKTVMAIWKAVWIL